VNSAPRSGRPSSSLVFAAGRQSAAGNGIFVAGDRRAESALETTVVLGDRGAPKKKQREMPAKAAISLAGANIQVSEDRVVGTLVLEPGTR
jgi:hypothetical protein